VRPTPDNKLGTDPAKNKPGNGGLKEGSGRGERNALKAFGQAGGQSRNALAGI